MKKLLASALLAVSATVNAGPVFLMPMCTYGFSNYCTTNNNTKDIVTCNIQANGTTQKGMFISGFQYTTLHPYQTSWLYVYGNSYDDPVRFLTATAWCNTVN